eukprot:SAG22_NODE_519_length_9510_cov_6.192222_3_plen_147_part_00
MPCMHQKHTISVTHEHVHCGRDDSILGRSIVIHHAGGARMACATIFDAASPARAEAEFNSGPLEGSHVTFTQYAAAAPTIVTAHFPAILHSGSGWEIHSNIAGDTCSSDEVGGTCASDGSLPETDQQPSLVPCRHCASRRNRCAVF